MTLHLKEIGITDDQILEMNFESHNFKNMTSDSFYEYVKQHIQPDKRMSLFFDEVQRVPNWEDAINSFRVDFNCDIYVTDSNAYMFSSEYATYLSGRCVEIKMLPLSFSEFLTFHNFEIGETKSALGGTRMQAFDKTSEDVRKRELAPLQKISDNYEKIVLSLNTGMDSSYDGIKSINLIDWLISEYK